MSEPEPTATTEPVEQPEPTATTTTEPEPTATTTTEPEPTATTTTEPEPTATTTTEPEPTATTTTEPTATATTTTEPEPTATTTTEPEPTTTTDISGTQEIFSTIVGDLSGAPIRIPLSINDLLNSYEATIVKEATDRSTVAVFTTPSVESLKPALYKWAAAGFPAGYTINTISIAPPTLCSDGVNRKLTYYFEWLLGKPIADWLQALDDVTDGMIFTFSHDGTNKITLRVTRT
jgi:hypothetical protein